MKLSTIDILIVAAYLVVLLVIGVVMKRRAARSKDAYLLGGKSLPWYMLGLSNASGMFDISGTMWMVMLAFVYGLKSIWIPWLWPCFNQIFLMIYLAAWLRRSNATTGAEWISMRFGKGKGATLSHTIVIIFALMSCLGFLAYGFIGLGKFVQIFIPWDVVAPFIPFDVPLQYVPHLYGVVFTLFAVFYSVLGGMASIVWADVIQYAIMTVSAIAVAVIAMMALGQGVLHVPEGWSSPFFGASLNLDWSGIIDGVNEKIASDGYSLFSIFFMMMLFKGIFASIAGPAPNYDMQKILSSKSPMEATKMSTMVSIVLVPTRYLMIMGFAVLGLLFYNQLDLGNPADFEQILPAAIAKFIPVGLTGLLLAGLLAAFMGTFAGTLNAAQAYIVNDIYLKYVNPNAPARKISALSYTVGIFTVAFSILLGIFARDVNSILQWIVSGLYGGYVAANVLKWHWWRFNGSGFFWGMIGGILPALVFPFIFDFLDLYYFPIILLLSIAGCVIGTYAAPATDEQTLVNFYRKVRPWGFWKPVDKRTKELYPDFRNDSRFARDMIHVCVGVVAQVALAALPMYFVLKQVFPLWVSALILVVCVVALKKFWWDRYKADFERQEDEKTEEKQNITV